LKKLLVLGLLIALCIVVSPVLADASISTDKPDYSPEMIVKITGEGFTSGVPVTITVTRPDGKTDPAVYPITPNPVYPDQYGAFSVNYQLDGISGLYSVDAIDSDGVKAYTTFSDTALVPEFPSMALPVVMMFGVIGFVYFIKLREN
jgi:hypothetical protein